MLNIKLSYLYRDSANYKKHGYVVFANPNQVDFQDLESIILSKLIDDIWFYASQWGLPNFFPETFNPDVDPTWHEFDNIYFTEESPTLNNSLEVLIEKISNLKV